MLSLCAVDTATTLVWDSPAGPLSPRATNALMEAGATASATASNSPLSPGRQFSLYDLACNVEDFRSCQELCEDLDQVLTEREGETCSHLTSLLGELDEQLLELDTKLLRILRGLNSCHCA